MGGCQFAGCSAIPFLKEYKRALLGCTLSGLLLTKGKKREKGSGPNGTSGFQVTTYGEGAFSMRADRRPHAREDASMLVRRAQRLDFATQRIETHPFASDSHIGLADGAFFRLT